MGVIDNIGSPLANRLRNLSSFSIFVYETFKSFFANIRHGKKLLLRITSYQILFTAIEALPITLFISVFLFSAVVKQVDIFIPKIGAGMFLGKIFVILIVRELAPLIIAFVLISRSGTAIAAEISSMMVNDEINSLKVLGIDPHYIIVVPRVVGMVLSLVCLSFIFTVVTILGGMLLANYYLDIPVSQYMDGIFSSVTPLDVLINVMKSIIFGLIISFVCCFYGMSTKYAPTEIPQVATKAVIYSFVWCFLFSAAITVIYY